MKKLLLALSAIGVLALAALIAFPFFAKAQYVVLNNTMQPVLLASSTIPTNAPLNVQLPNTYAYISTNNSTTTVASSSGLLHTLTFDTVGTSSIVTIYDSTGTATGAIIARIVLATTTSVSPFTLTYDVLYNNGLVIQQTGNTSTMTISY